jgi:hypothetical protein
MSSSPAWLPLFTERLFQPVDIGATYPSAAEEEFLWRIASSGQRVMSDSSPMASPAKSLSSANPLG